MLEINKIYNADCLEKMNEIEDKSIDMILCDLPYGTTRCKWDSIIPLDKLWEQYNRIIKDNGCIALFAQVPFNIILGNSNLNMLRYEWIWEKTSATGHLNANKMPMKAHENIMIFYKKLPTYNPQMTTGHNPTHSFTKRVEVQNKSELYGKVNKEISGGGSTIRYPRDVLTFKSEKQTNAIHPTQKPVEIYEYLIKTYTNEGDLILDNCCGSGTLGVACINTNRNYIMMDNGKCEKKNNNYGRYWSDIAQERINTYLNNLNKNIK